MTYDQWRTDSGYGEPDEPEFYCDDCLDFGYVLDLGETEADDRFVLCRCCSPLGLRDLDDWVPPNQVGCADGRDDRPDEQQGCGLPGQADARATR